MRVVVTGHLPSVFGLASAQVRDAAAFFAARSHARLIREGRACRDRGRNKLRPSHLLPPPGGSQFIATDAPLQGGAHSIATDVPPPGGSQFIATDAPLLGGAQFIATDADAPVWHEITIHLVRDAESDAMHRAIMSVAGATDVITQAYDAIPPEPPGLFGELFVNTDCALRAAPRRRGWSPAKELLLYIAHGMDHLSGADDHSPADYACMRRRELAWLRVWPQK